MIEIKTIDAAHKQDILLPNQPFPIFGRMIPSCQDGRWSYTTRRFDTAGEMCFPDEPYNFDEMSKNSVFLGAYDREECIGLAILQDYFLKYMYLYDLKVNAAWRGRGIGRQLIEKAKEVARQRNYRGIYLQGQDNNLGACLFYISSGFRIGGFDTEVYNGTSQEGTADIIFYLDC